MKLPHWTATCEIHGKIEAHQESPPVRCHRVVRLGVTCRRLLQRVKKSRPAERRPS